MARRHKPKTVTGRHEGGGQLIGFHGNHNHIHDVTGNRHLGFSNFRIFSHSL